jgi:hypothetical protein
MAPLASAGAAVGAMERFAVDGAVAAVRAALALPGRGRAAA